MKIDTISSFNSITSIKHQNRYLRTFQANRISPLVDTFERSASLVEKTALAKLKKFNLNEYNLLTETEKRVLRDSIKASNQNFSWDLDLHQYASECIKQSLDREYGVGKYVVVTIGRSLSSIGKFLGFKIGEDNVKNIPLSDLSGVDTKGTASIEYFKTVADCDAYNEMLDSVGLSKKDIDSSEKKYILIDYACSGNSIKNAYKILSSDTFWGNKDKKVTFSAIQDFLAPKDYSKKFADLSVAMAFSKFKKYSFIDRLHKRESFVSESLKPKVWEKTDDAKNIKKLFAFMMLDSYYGKHYPLKEYQINSNLEPSYLKQVKQNWLSPNRQFNKDVFIDIYELDKAILRTSDNDMKDKMETLKSQLKNSSPYGYYSELKPKVDEILKQGFDK